MSKTTKQRYVPTVEEFGAAETANGFGWLIEWDGGWGTSPSYSAGAVLIANAHPDSRIVPNVPLPA